MATNDASPREFFPSGQPAPNFKLLAVKTGKVISPKNASGQVLGLVFHGRETVQAVVDINTTVRPVYPEPSPVILASVVDLSVVPRLLHRAVKPLLEQAYDQAARQIPQGYDPADYVYLLPDWNGAVTKAFRVAHPDKTAAFVVIDDAGQVVGSYQGPEPGPVALGLIQRALHAQALGT